MGTHMSTGVNTGADGGEVAGVAGWRLASGRFFDLSRPRVMAIINATPDSFSDGGAHLDPSRAADAAARFLQDGAAILDVGGESTRPGAAAVKACEQIARTVPVIEAIRRSGACAPISIDTTRAAVAQAALDAGADVINDVSGGTDDPAILELAAARGCGVILMHRTERPAESTYSNAYTKLPSYVGGVVASVRESLGKLALRACEYGCAPEAVVLDPGLGFGKSVAQNVELMKAFDRLGVMDDGRVYPLLAAASRKSFVGHLSVSGLRSIRSNTRSGQDRAAGLQEIDAEVIEPAASPEPPGPDDRLGASIACAITMLHGGARLFRVHDVRAHVHALAAASAM